MRLTVTTLAASAVFAAGSLAAVPAFADAVADAKAFAAKVATPGAPTLGPKRARVNYRKRSGA